MIEKFSKKTSKGFSFTEMSVVLASVAAIILLTYSGVSMVKKTKFRNILSDVSNFTRSIEQFETKYGALPGDIATLIELPGATGAGNGNGIIDDGNEALKAWHHLSISGLIDNSYNGIDENIPGLGVPEADIEGGGYKIIAADDTGFNNDADNSNDIPSQAFIIELSGFSSTSSSLPILTTEDAKIIDEAADDGNPVTGSILSEGQSNDCVTSGGKYNLSEKIASCRMLFIVKGARTHQNAPQVSGSCNELGQTRQKSDFNQKCPQGYEGMIVETCRIDSDNQGTWEITERKCIEVKCNGGGSYGDNRRLSCVNGMVGTEGIVEQCTKNGVWEVLRSDCTHKSDLACKTDGDIRKAQACDWGKKGFVLQTCTNNKWETPSTAPNFQCSNIKCGASNVGAAQSSSNCGTNYTGDVIRVCTVATTWEETSVGSTCVPLYGSCNAGSDSTKEIGCPPGKRGKHTLQCIDNNSSDYWTTLTDTCEPIQCSGGYNIGSSRIKEGASCPNDSNGQVMEYCDETGTWQTTFTNCVEGVCESPKDNKGNALWPTTRGGTTAYYTSCVPGYTESTGTPTRACNTDGTWSDFVSAACERKKCPANFQNASYPDPTYAGESNVSSVSCDAGYTKQSPQYPISDCKIDGTWDNERIPCVLNPLSGCSAVLSHTTSLLSHLDACEGNVFSNTICTTPAVLDSANTVRCLKDKTGNGRHAILLESRPTYVSNGFGSIPAIDFKASEFDSLQISGLPSSIGSNGAEIFAAIKKNQHYAGTMFIGARTIKTAGLWTFGNQSLLQDFLSGSPIRERFFTSSTHDFPPPTGYYAPDNGLYNTTSIPGNFTTRIDGRVVYQSTSNLVISSSTATIGAYYPSSGPDEFFDGKMGEIALYQGGLTNSERNSVEAYFGDKWSIDLNRTYYGLIIHLDASNASTVFSDENCTTSTTINTNNSVECWKDISGNDYNAIIDRANRKQPNYVSNGIDTLNAIDFNAADNDYLEIPSYVGEKVFPTHSLEYTGAEIFLVLKKDENFSPDTLRSGLWNFNNSTTFPNNADGRIDEGFGTNVIRNDIAYPGTINLSNNTLYNVTTTSSEYVVRINNYQAFYSATNTVDFTGGPDIGRSNSSRYFNGRMGEIQIYNQDLSTLERDNIEQALSDKWNITLE